MKSLLEVSSRLIEIAGEDFLTDFVVDDSGEERTVGCDDEELQEAWDEFIETVYRLETEKALRESKRGDKKQNGHATSTAPLTTPAPSTAITTSPASTSALGVQQGTVGKYGSAYQQAPATTGKYTKACTHTGSDVVWFGDNGKTLAGARGYQLNYANADLVIDCANLAKTATGLSGTATTLIKQLNMYTATPDVLKLDWPDREAPNFLKPEFWPKLWEAIPHNTRVVACCIGSHGRTGTTLACLILANLASSDENLEIENKVREGYFWEGRSLDASKVIRFVRERHCNEAIETTSQENYIAYVAAWLSTMKSCEEKEIESTDTNKIFTEEYTWQLEQLAQMDKEAESLVRPRESSKSHSITSMWDPSLT